MLYARDMTRSQSKGARGVLAALAFVVLCWPAPARTEDQSQPQPAALPAAPDAKPATAQTAQPGSEPAAALDGGESAKTPGAAHSASGADASAPAPSASPGAKKTLRQGPKSVLTKINPKRLLRDRAYQKAATTFLTFCKDWERRLRDRESFNLTSIAWKLKDGFETAVYTGYSNVESCTTKETDSGFALGKLTYEEIEYYLAGKTRDEALHAKPQPAGKTHTTEIFRWDKGKWFY